MKLNTKLKISFICMFLIPIIICTVGAGVILVLQDYAFKNAYNEEGMGLADSMTPLPMLSKVTNSVYDDLNRCSVEEPEKFNDQEYLQWWSERVAKRFSSFVVKKNNVIIYSNSTMGQDFLYGVLPEYGENEKNNAEYGVYFGGRYQCLVKQLDFADAQNNHYSVFIITAAQMIPQIRWMFLQFAGIIIMTLICTSLVLTLWMNRSMVRPILRLKEATQNIKEGNLDFELPINDGKDEISSLTRDFEEMRIILKDTSEEKLKTEVEEKEMIRNISHDLKTPLTAIKGYVEGLMDGVADTPEKRQKYLQTIYNKANDMDRLIDELTMYSRIDMNRVTYTFQRIDIDAYMTDCCEDIGIDLEAKGISLEYHNYSDEAQFVMIDGEQMKRVINNIVNNSVKYMANRKGVIKIEIYNEGENVLMRIEDNGKGIAKEDLQHIFERFYRADSSRGTKVGGSGIGLAIVKKIMEDHGGTIWAESEEGIGTTMNLRLKKVR